MKNFIKKFIKSFTSEKPVEVKNVEPITDPIIPISGGVRRKYCSCGGIIINSGRDVIRELCSECGKPYHESVYK